MEVIEPGHKYLLEKLDGTGKETLTFVRRSLPHLPRTPEECHAGTNCQEVLRVIIDRVLSLDRELPHLHNQTILKNLRLALVGFEVRAIERKVQKGTLFPEKVKTDPKDGHFILNLES